MIYQILYHYKILVKMSDAKNIMTICFDINIRLMILDRLDFFN